MKLRIINEIRSERWITATYSGKPDYVYRGMSIEEWEEALKLGRIQSDSRYCYPGQKGGTCYGTFKDAEHYGIENEVEEPNDITWNWKSEYQRPRPYSGIIIEIPRSMVKGHQEDPRVHDGEYMHFEPLPLSVISRVWELIPYVDNNKIVYVRNEIKVP